MNKAIPALLALLLLAACGSTAGTSAPTPAPPTAVPPTSTSAPPAVALSPTPAPTATSAPTVAPTPVPPTATPSPAPPRYVFPLQPPEAGRYPVCHHDYPAADIFAPVGTLFVAVTGGVVDFVSAEDTWTSATNDPALRGGLSVAIVGDDGVRYYGSHLSEVVEGIVPGARVEAGQPLGRTGDSGNAAGTDPHLHFGISRPTTPDDWRVRRGEVNPKPYLDAWRAGEQVTPDLGETGGGVC